MEDGVKAKLLLAGINDTNELFNFIKDGNDINFNQLSRIDRLGKTSISKIRELFTMNFPISIDRSMFHILWYRKLNTVLDINIRIMVPTDISEVVHEAIQRFINRNDINCKSTDLYPEELVMQLDEIVSNANDIESVLTYFIGYVQEVVRLNAIEYMNKKIYLTDTKLPSNLIRRLNWNDFVTVYDVFFSCEDDGEIDFSKLGRIRALGQKSVDIISEILSEYKGVIVIEEYDLFKGE
jgi:hypothetical protein